MKLTHITSRYRAKLIANVYDGWLKNNSKTLDVGCGSGVVTKELTLMFNLKATGCDIDKYLATEINFVKMKINTRLPFKDKVFKYSMFNDVLHHIHYPNQIKLIKEALRVSEEVLIFELKPTLPGKLFDFILNKIHNPHMPIPYTYRTESQWEEVFENLGLKVKVKYAQKPLFYPFTHIGFRLSKTKRK